MKENEKHENSTFVHPGKSDQMLYTNGIVGGHSAVDVYIVGMLNGNPNFTLNMSYSTAKQLQSVMNSIISELEEVGIPVSDVNDNIKKLATKRKSSL